MRDKTEILRNKQKDLISSTSAKAATISVERFGGEVGDLMGWHVLDEWQSFGPPEREHEAKPQAWDSQNLKWLQRSRFRDGKTQSYPPELPSELTGTEQTQHSAKSDHTTLRKRVRIL